MSENNSKSEEQNIDNKTKIKDGEEQKENDLEIEKNDDNDDKSIVIEEDNPDQLKIDKLESDLSDSKNEKLRLLAEMENLRKRFEKEKIDSIKYGNSALIRDFLSPCDNLIRALETLSEDDKNNNQNKNLINGLTMVHQEINTLLERHGVTKIKAINERFDHNLHQAMMEIETDKESGIILKELQVGYMIHDRLLRPSMVAVSKKEEKNKKNEENKEN